MSEQDGGPAFPTIYLNNNRVVNGMSLRDWFAGQALSGVVCTQKGTAISAQVAYEFADAMLKEREDNAA